MSFAKSSQSLVRVLNAAEGDMGGLMERERELVDWRKMLRS